MATQYANGKIVTSGLVLALDAADRNSYVSGSTVWNDVSGNGNNGTLTNGPTFSNNSIVFDGIDDYISCITNITIGSAFSMESFIYINSRTGGDIMSSWNNPFKFLWRINTSGYQLIAWDGGGPAQETLGTSVVNTGTWVCIVVTYDGTNVRFYNNAVLTDTNAKTFSISNFIAMQIAANTYDNVYFDGKIANGKIYNRALSAQEILQNYNAQKSRFNL